MTNIIRFDNAKDEIERNKWQEYARRKSALPRLSQQQFDAEIKKILKELGI